MRKVHESYRRGSECCLRSPSVDASDEDAQPWSVSEASLRRYVIHASERCVQDLLALSGKDEVEGWKSLTPKFGIEISQKKSEPVAVVRGRSLLKISHSRFKTVANSIDTAKQWDSHFVEGQYIKSLQENLDIFRLVFGGGSGPMLKNRDFVVYERRETMDDGTLVVAISSLPNAISSGLVPEDGKHIRGMVMQSGWVLDKLDHNSCMVTYVIQLDPGGWLPKWIVNKLSLSLVLVINHLFQLLLENQGRSNPSLQRSYSERGFTRVSTLRQGKTPTLIGRQL